MALATPTRRLAHLLSPPNRRLHVVAAALQLAENSLRSHFALQMLDGSLNTLLANGDLEGFTLDCFARIRQGVAGMTKTVRGCKPLDAEQCARGACGARLGEHAVQNALPGTSRWLADRLTSSAPHPRPLDQGKMGRISAVLWGGWWSRWGI